ncbi:hypothetical protein Tsubulata_002413 [Turnera subulata]|uniref:Pentacotripeptide-repeat region of PRORP domain-containing protein n=1 Tax=Turnera subulata TaxID=218843 RepID=A0A9Q0JC79_9ROSI|nr:hypothetical protein Tsubulata_002413 [Turnera subulata]
MKREGFQLDEVTYGVIVNCLCKSGRLDEAMDCLEFCRGNGVAVNAIFYSSLIHVLGKAGRVDEAESCGKIDDALALFKRMDSEGCDLIVYTYTTFISGLFRQHRNEEALGMWEMMIDNGITPIAVAFCALSIGLCLSEDMLNALYRAGRIKEACKLAEGIVEKGKEIPRRVRTFLINALRKAGNADLSLKLMHSKIGIGYDRMGSIKR